MDERLATEIMHQDGECCACEGTLADGHLNMVQLAKAAKWEFPIGGNILTGEAKRAIAIVCDKCIVDKTPIKRAVQLDGETLTYHDVDGLEDAELGNIRMVSKNFDAEGEPDLEKYR